MSHRNHHGGGKRHENRRIYLLNRFGDGEKCRCVYCGEILTKETMTIERLVPGKHGGTYARNNIFPACEYCNSSRGDEILAIQYTSL